jgi:hypothetical protein
MTAPPAARLRDDRGQSVIEFTGMVPIILVTLAVLWQSALVGYTFVLAGNAADKGVAAEEDLTGGWSATVDCGPDGDLYTAEVALEVPLLFPGVNLPITVEGRAGAATEWRSGP